MVIKAVRAALKEENFDIVLGIFFLVLQAFVIFYQWINNNIIVMYWFCNHILLVFGISFIFRKYDLIKAFICVGIIPQIIWALDFFFRIFSGHYLIGMTEYVFQSGNLLGALVPLNVHLMSTFIAFLATYKKRTRPQILIYCAVYILIIYSLSIAFTPESLNANCVFRPCVISDLMPQNYVYFWPFLAFFLVVLPSFALQYVLSKIWSKPKISRRKRKV